LFVKELTGLQVANEVLRALDLVTKRDRVNDVLLAAKGLVVDFS
jgi:hypothetical protein